MLLDMAHIRIDGGTQSRVELNNETVEDYSDAMRGGAVFPPVVVFFDGATHWLADGFHRYFGSRHAGLEQIEADVRDGTQLDAQLFSFGVNTDHGLRRTNADKRKAVSGALNHPISSKWSDNQIAKHCGVHHSTVGDYRRALADSASAKTAERTYTTKHGTTSVMNTDKIGKSPKKSKDAPINEPVAQSSATQVIVTDQKEYQDHEDPDEYTDLDAAYDQISELQAALVVARLGDVPEEEKNQASEHIADLNSEIKTLRASLKAVTLSRDSLMEERAQMMRQMKAQRAEIERLKSRN